MEVVDHCCDLRLRVCLRVHIIICANGVCSRGGAGIAQWLEHRTRD